MIRAKSTARFTGGRRLQRMITDMKRNRVTSVDVGFFSTARYEDGTQVAAVAAYNEFGTKRIPERPFFRRAIMRIERELAGVITKGIDRRRFVADSRLAGIIGAWARDVIQESITDLDQPPNAASTIEQKAGKRKGKARRQAIEGNTPLIDTGVMRNKVGWRVNR